MIKKEMNPLEIVEAYPQTQEAFHHYDEVIGKCLLCYHLFDSLETICQEYQLDLKDMMDGLSKDIQEKGAGD